MRATTATHIQKRRQREAGRKNSPRRKSNENQRHTSRKTAATKSVDYYQLVARATKDAIRDWDLTSGTLTWPQGLDPLRSEERRVGKEWRSRWSRVQEI